MNPLIAMPGGSEWLIILAIVILVFGASKLPELARGTGQALRIFKSETKGLRDDDAKDDTTPAPPVGEIAPPAPAPSPTPTPTPAEDLSATEGNPDTRTS